MLKMAVLLSGSGRTLDNFHEEIQKGKLQAEVQVVVSNVADALGLEKAKRYGYPAFHAVGSDRTNAILADYDIDIICLAGYLKLYTPPQGLEKSVINIHPSLLPKYGGKGMYGINVHNEVIKNKETESGISIHYVNKHYDKGRIIFQKNVEITYPITALGLSKKIHELEMKFFPKVIEQLINSEGND